MPRLRFHLSAELFQHWCKSAANHISSPHKRRQQNELAESYRTLSPSHLQSNASRDWTAFYMVKESHGIRWYALEGEMNTT